MKKNIRKSGHVKFTIKHDDLDWTTNSKAYDFGTNTERGVSLKVIKHPYGMLQFDITGPLGEDFELNIPIPANCPTVLPAAVSWGRNRLSVYLNNVIVGEVQLVD